MAQDDETTRRNQTRKVKYNSKEPAHVNFVFENRRQVTLWFPTGRYPARIRSRATIGPTAKRHSNAFRWWDNSGPLFNAN